MGKEKMIKLVDLITEDRTTDDTDRWVLFYNLNLI